MRLLTFSTLYPNGAEDCAVARSVFGMTRFSLVSVCHLIPRNSHNLVVEALTRFPETQLLIAEIGPNVWDAPEVVAAPDAGVLMTERSAAGNVDAVAVLRSQLPSRPGGAVHHA